MPSSRLRAAVGTTGRCGTPAARQRSYLLTACLLKSAPGWGFGRTQLDGNPAG
jgi:hypothetical protein